jgi:spore coat protein U-like protein
MNIMTQRLIIALLALSGASTAWAVPTCTVASAGTLSFGTVVALASSPDVTTNTGSSFWVNCTADVPGTPSIYSGSSRVMVAGGNSLPFSLSAESPGGLALQTGSPGSALAITKNGTNETVTLYGKVFVADFKALPSGVYSAVIMVTVEY